MSNPPEMQVIVRFGDGIPVDARNAALLEFERDLRRRTSHLHLRIEVFQERRGDDSKLRNAMTAEQRNKL
jgi:hypothetical protein